MVMRHRNEAVFCRAEKYRKNSKAHSQNFEIKNAEISNLRRENEEKSESSYFGII